MCDNSKVVQPPGWVALCPRMLAPCSKAEPVFVGQGQLWPTVAAVPARAGVGMSSGSLPGLCGRGRLACDCQGPLCRDRQGCAALRYLSVPCCTGESHGCHQRPRVAPWGVPCQWHSSSSGTHLPVALVSQWHSSSSAWGGQLGACCCPVATASQQGRSEPASAVCDTTKIVQCVTRCQVLAPLEMSR